MPHARPSSDGSPHGGRYWMTTFGCQMNVHDSERMEEVLLRAGYGPASAAQDADVILLNTCSVREKAEQKLRSEVGRIAKLKRQKPDTLLVVAGCVAQQEGERLQKRIPEIDLILGPDNIAELPMLLSELEGGGLPRTRTVFDVDAPRFLSASSVAGAATTAFVTTMKGCNERCSFCIVPYTRGPERYRPSREVIGEIAQLVRAGVREITLLGQTVNSYRDPEHALGPAPGYDPDDPDESEFAALVRAIAERVPDLVRLRYTSPHPRHLTPSLIRAHAELAVMPRHVHMPVQSGSDRVLKRMIRRYRIDEYKARIAALRDAAPGLTVSTDIIVGFPGETEEDFEATLDLVRAVGFVGVFGFKYSQRPYTPALKLADDVDEPTKSDRLRRLFEISEALIAAHLAGLVGQELEVLVEGPGRAASGPGAYDGRSERHEIVHVRDPRAERLVGQLARVRVVEAFKHSVLAELTEEAEALANRRAALAPAVPTLPHQRRPLPVLQAKSQEDGWRS